MPIYTHVVYTSTRYLYWYRRALRVCKMRYFQYRYCSTFTGGFIRPTLVVVQYISQRCWCTIVFVYTDIYEPNTAGFKKWEYNTLLVQKSTIHELSHSHHVKPSFSVTYDSKTITAVIFLLAIGFSLSSPLLYWSTSTHTTVPAKCIHWFSTYLLPGGTIGLYSYLYCTTWYSEYYYR